MSEQSPYSSSSEESFALDAALKPRLRQFSKVHMPEQRQQTLESIRTARQMRDETSRELGKIPQKILDNQQKIDNAQREIVESEKRLELLGAVLSRRESSILAQALDIVRFNRKRKIRKEQENAQATKQDAETYVAGRENSIFYLKSQYAQLLQDKSNYERSQQRYLSDHYYQAASRYQEYQAEQDLLQLERYKKQNGRIDKVSRDNNVYFIHATGEGHGDALSAESNPFIRQDENITWLNKAAFVIEKQPQICTSTISPDSSLFRGFGNVGLVLGRGIIEYASPVDAQSEISQDLTRDKSTAIKSVYEYTESIGQAIAASQSKGHGDIYEYDGKEYSNEGSYWNELLVSGAEAAAVFVAIYRKEGVGTMPLDYTIGVRTTLSDVFCGAKLLGNLPVVGFYAESSSMAYELKVNAETQQVEPIRPIAPQEVAEMEPSREQSADIKELANILKDNPLAAAI